MNNLIVIAVYFLLWTIFSEVLTFESNAIGLLIVVFLTISNSDLYDLKKYYYSPKKIISYIKYTVILLAEIIKANIHVAIIVLSKNPNLSPCIIEHKTGLKNDFHKMILANSITLTPGTLTISLNNDTLKVHCLKEYFKEDIFDSKFEKILLEIEELNNATI